jgi:UDP-sugar transporter A1/2/3
VPTIPLSLWAGFSPIVWFVVLNQAVGGLLVALVSDPLPSSSRLSVS